MSKTKKATEDLVAALQRAEAPNESASSYYSEKAYGKPPSLYPELQEVPSDAVTQASSMVIRKVGQTVLILGL